MFPFGLSSFISTVSDEGSSESSLYFPSPKTLVFNQMRYHRGPCSTAACCLPRPGRCGKTAKSLTWVLCFECLSCLFLVWYQVLFFCFLFVWRPRRNQGIPLPSILLPSVFLFWYHAESKSVICHTESHRLYKLVV